MLLDTIFVYKTKQIPLIEKANTHSGIEIGFKITNINLDLMGEYYRNTFVYIGNSNPFQTRNVHPIQWRQVDSTLFPSNIKSTNHKPWFDSYSRREVFQFSTDSLTYLIQNLTSSKETLQARHLIIKESISDSVLFNMVYNDDEGTGLSPLFNVKENIQWTGQIFKDKPSIVYGFLLVSFGCPWIDFVGVKESSIRILCDNRH